MKSRSRHAGGFSHLTPKGATIINFTDNKDRFYENMMREIPNFNKRGEGYYTPKFRYRFRDLDCRYCAECGTCPPVCLCPSILENLPDLKDDREFIIAVLAAETCETPQRLTLLYLLEGRVCV